MFIKITGFECIPNWFQARASKNSSHVPTPPGREIIESDNLVSQAKENGKYLSEGLESLAHNHDPVSNVRNKGLFGAFDLPTTEIRDKAINLIADEGALMLGCGTKSIRFRPHLNISTAEIDLGLEMIDRALNHL